MSGQPNEVGKIPLIGFHMAFGLATLIALVVRMIVRLRLPKPSPVSTGRSILDQFAKFIHGDLYLFVLLMAVSGLSLSVQSGLTWIVFGGSGSPLPSDFYAFNARTLHGVIAPVLQFLILLHAGAALYHQFFFRIPSWRGCGTGKHKYEKTSNIRWIGFDFSCL